MNEYKGDQFVPYFILEKYFENKYLPFIKIESGFIEYTASYFGIKENKIKYFSGIDWINDQYIKYICMEIYLKNGNFYEIKLFKNENITIKLYHLTNSSSYSKTWSPTGADFKSFIFANSSETKKFLNLYWNHKEFELDMFYPKKLKTNKSELLFCYQICSDCIIFSLDDNTFEDSIQIYRKYIDSKVVKQSFADDKKYSEEDIGKMLIQLKVDISSFSEKEQEEIKQLYISTIGELEKEEEDRLREFREIQINRIMLAYQKFKEIAELLNDTKMDLQFDKIKINNLENIIFKNNGNPTENGYIEFDDFFKNNMILKMLDLSQLDLTNVNITYMDFSGTNIHIDPQIIYNKDMTNVNAFGVEFSILDSFDGVILDGAKINDWNAMIYLEKLKSYNDSTVIRKDVLFNGKTI